MRRRARCEVVRRRADLRQPRQVGYRRNRIVWLFSLSASESSPCAPESGKPPWISAYCAGHLLNLRQEPQVVTVSAVKLVKWLAGAHRPV